MIFLLFSYYIAIKYFDEGSCFVQTLVCGDRFALIGSS